MNVTHGDLKPSHILQDEQGRIFFIDFGYSELAPNNLTPARGFTAKWTSFDAILHCTVHELDDYEAVFTSALLETLKLLGKIGEGLPPEPEKDTKSLKRWAAWKLQLIDYVYTLFSVQQSSSTSSSSPVQAALEFAVRGLMLVWTLPRTRERLDNIKRENLSLAKVDFPQHAAKVRADFLSHLGRSKGSRVHLALNAPREVVLVNESDGTKTTSEELQQEHVWTIVKAKNPNAKECPSVFCYPTAIQRDTPLEASQPNDPNKPEIRGEEWWAEYDTLIFNDDDEKKEHTWQYEDNWKFLGQHAEYGVKLLKAISGKYLYLEATFDNKHIWYFAGKFENFIRQYYLRPIDVLLLIIGIQIECHNEDFFPRNFGIVLDVVQHGQWKCQGPNCRKDLRYPDAASEHFYFCHETRLYLCSQCESRKVCCTDAHVKFNTKSTWSSLLPNLSLFTLLLAGRVRTTNELSPQVVETHKCTSTEAYLRHQKLEEELEKQRALTAQEVEKRHRAEAQLEERGKQLEQMKAQFEERRKQFEERKQAQMNAQLEAQTNAQLEAQMNAQLETQTNAQLEAQRQAEEQMKARLEDQQKQAEERMKAQLEAQREDQQKQTAAQFEAFKAQMQEQFNAFREQRTELEKKIEALQDEIKRLQAERELANAEDEEEPEQKGGTPSVLPGAAAVIHTDRPTKKTRSQMRRARRRKKQQQDNQL